MDTAQVIKFNLYFKAFVSFLKDSFPEHKSVSELDNLFETMSAFQPGKMRRLFDDHIRKPYEAQINNCDVAVIDEIHSRGDDILNVHEMWQSPNFDELKKAQCFQHLIQICQTYH